MTANRKALSHPERILAAWKRWKGAARKFKGLGIHLEARTDLRHITRTRYGFQVRVIRTAQRPFRRSVVGHSEESLHEAMRIRDQALRTRPSPIVNKIPARVLRALGLSTPVIGITRLPSRSVYRVHYTDRGGRKRMAQFYYRAVPEEDAYAAAIAFLESLLK